MPGASVLVGDQEDRFNRTLKQLRDLYDCFDELSEAFVTRAGITKDELRAVQAASKIADRASYEERALDARKRDTIERGRAIGQKQILQLFAD
jgi:hypothetical protein